MLEPRPNRDSLPLVLVVDDDPSIRKSLARLFKAAGLNVESFDSARAFLERGGVPALAGLSRCSVLDGPGYRLLDAACLRSAAVEPASDS